MTSEENLSVIVRIRPPLYNEATLDQCVEVARVGTTNAIKLRTKNHNITCGYDSVISPDASQSDVYDHVKHVVEAVTSGINATIFAYGQTGSGKTHTMLGANLEQTVAEGKNLNWNQSSIGGAQELVHEDYGIIPRTVLDLFQQLEEQNGNEPSTNDDEEEDNRENEVTDQHFVVHASYMQIYNNNLFDLLSDSDLQRPLQVRENHNSNGSKDIFVQGISEYRVSSAKDVLDLLQHGGRNRATRSTNYNESSSRSHAILQMSIQVKSIQKGGGRHGGMGMVTKTAKLNLVDLAGSERWDTSGADADRHMRRELTQINTSLSALGNCISRLTEENITHVPYRDSQLTRLLEDSLGGNTRTVVLATITMLARDAEVTESTLKFADRARQVMVRVKPNQQVDDKALLKEAEKEIARLMKRVETLENILMKEQIDVPEEEMGNGVSRHGISSATSSGIGSDKCTHNDIDQTQLLAQLRRENMRLRSENTSLRNEKRQQETNSAPSGRTVGAAYSLPVPGDLANHHHSVPSLHQQQRRKGKKGSRNRKKRRNNKIRGGVSCDPAIMRSVMATGDPYSKNQMPKKMRAKMNRRKEMMAPPLLISTSSLKSNQKQQYYHKQPPPPVAMEQECYSNDYRNENDEDEWNECRPQQDHHQPASPEDDNDRYDSGSNSDDSDTTRNMPFGGVLAGRLDARVAQHGDWGGENERTVTNKGEGAVVSTVTNTTTNTNDKGERRPQLIELESEDYEISGFGDGDEDLMVDSGNDDREESENENENAVLVKKRESLREIRDKKNKQMAEKRRKKVFANRTNRQHSNNQQKKKSGNKKIKLGGSAAELKKKERRKQQQMKNKDEEKQLRNQRITARAERMKQDIGKRLSIYSSKYDEWTEGKIIDIDAERRMHCVEYEDNERRWHRMDLLKFSII
jgi:hypothetical protein